MTYPYAVIIADPNATALGNIHSRHRKLAAAEKSIDALPDTPDNRWAYIARIRDDGEYEHRVEAQDHWQREAIHVC